MATLSLLLLPGCGDRDTPPGASTEIAANDYESVIGWMPDPKTVTRERAHSGRYAVKVDATNEYGLGYSQVLAKAVDHKPSKLRIEGWALMTDANAKARLGLQLFDLTTNRAVFGEGIDYDPTIKEYGKWVKISKDISLPANTISSQELRVFLWRAGATSPAYLDDLRISEVK